MNEQPANPYRAPEGEADLRVGSPARRKIADLPLSNGGKAFAFFGGFLGSPIAVIVVIRVTRRLWKRGEKRKVGDIWRWFGLGFLSLVVILFGLGALEQLGR